ncbi:hypothetical protein SAMN05216548_12618 [Faunimonas pinastri]|uniref:Uncharacterized protein n=1 Tax=Faunimonas pinastri TaxID=1855383 RepID=A0A1H9Q9E4_9HYPH|nr:hypothetical protein [Faunimonas pinastri]SER57131.1 hypothetical protein SAMN05216548_12618 [Faunimonas pinastri]
MTTKIWVRPKTPGSTLAHPVSGPIRDSGRRWLDDAFTRRRIADGDIEEFDPDAEKASDTSAAVTSGTASTADATSAASTGTTAASTAASTAAAPAASSTTTKAADTASASTTTGT